MTKEELDECRKADWQGMRLGNKKVDELCDEIERLHATNEEANKHQAIVVERLMIERDAARKELARRKAPPQCPKCGCRVMLIQQDVALRGNCFCEHCFNTTGMCVSVDAALDAWRGKEKK
jgi:hypothetical protein